MVSLERWAKRLKWVFVGDNVLLEAMELAKITAREALEDVKEMLPGKKERPRLTREKQLDYFFKHTGEDFDVLRQRVGNDEFEQYFAAMRKLAEQR